MIQGLNGLATRRHATEHPLEFSLVVILELLAKGVKSALTIEQDA